MEIDGFEVSKVAAGFVVSYISDQQQVKAHAAQIAQLLNENNESIFKGVSRLVNQALSQMKLNQCNNLVKTITIFMDEYNVNPNDTAKLIAVDQKSAELLDVLNDPDIAVAGIANWMIIASIRIMALQEKSKIAPADLVNAKNRANDYSDYVNEMKEKVLLGIRAGFGSVQDFGLPQPGVIAVGPGAIGWGYLIDNWNHHSNFDSEAEAAADREETIEKKSAPRIAKMENTVKDWRKFASS